MCNCNSRKAYYDMYHGPLSMILWRHTTGIVGNCIRKILFWTVKLEGEKGIGQMFFFIPVAVLSRDLQTDATVTAGEMTGMNR